MAWPTIRLLALALVVLLPLTWWLARSLRTSELGDDTAAGLGVSRGPERGAPAAVGVLLGAVAVAAAGPVAFVSFLAGPIARALNGGRTTPARVRHWSAP